MGDTDISQTHERFMGLAIDQARRALDQDEVPVGAVVVSPSGEVVGKGHNLRESCADPTAHAEIIALRQAGENTGDWRLSDCTVYVTVEPCPMCAGALVNARIPRLVFGVVDPKAGAVVSLFCLTSDDRLNHQIRQVVQGVCESECAELLGEFFRRLRSGR